MGCKDYVNVHFHKKKSEMANAKLGTGPRKVLCPNYGFMHRMCLSARETNPSDLGVTLPFAHHSSFFSGSRFPG